jgi:hypothetical protein
MSQRRYVVACGHEESDAEASAKGVDISGTSWILGHIFQPCRDVDVICGCDDIEGVVVNVCAEAETRENDGKLQAKKY